jgi:hypothetical protein
MTTVKDNAQTFLNACGATGPLRLRLEQPSAGRPRERVLGQPFAVVGAAVGADIRLAGPGVSKRQAYLQTLDGHLFCIALDARTKLGDGNLDATAGWLDEGHPVRLGPNRLWLVAGREEHRTALAPPATRAGCAPVTQAARPNPLASGSSAHLPLPAITLEFLQGDHTQSYWRMDRLIALVGRSPACKVRLEHVHVSRVHCSLVLTPEGPWVVDLLGGGGVRVNGRRVRFSPLADGDDIELGVFRIRCRYDNPSPGSSLALCPARPSTLVPGPPLATRAACAQVAPVAPPPTADPWGGGLGGLLPIHQALGSLEATDSGLVMRSLVGPLIEQFNQMQNQLFDQFRQAMLQMFHMFSSVQNDQMAFIREELDRLRDVTQELHALQAQLAKNPTGEPRTGPGGGAVQPTGRAAKPDKPAPPPAPEAHRGTLPPPLPGELADPPTNGEACPPPLEDPTDLHTLLCQRVETLQKERQGRWQRLMERLFGKRSGEEVP